MSSFDDGAPQKLSTSALAKALELPSQQLFSTLKDYGWIKKLEEGWALTSKGEFEGGEYVHSKRYGRYIVWPPEITEHPLLQALEDNRHVTATELGKTVGINAREANRVLAELGWLRHSIQGWELTPSGESKGGIQLENDNSGILYVVWPQSILDDAVLKRQLQNVANVYSQSMVLADDLFEQQTEFVSIDGHIHSNPALLKICHWLYMAGIAHACNRQLPVEENITADFYLPAHQLYIEYWHEPSAEQSGSLAKRMRRREIYQQSGFKVIDLEPADLEQLDEVMTKQLRHYGVRVI